MCSNLYNDLIWVVSVYSKKNTGYQFSRIKSREPGENQILHHQDKKVV